MRAVRGALLTGILLGTETGIPRSLLEDFNQASTNHIIAISGFNIAILGGTIALLTKRFLGIYRSALVSMAAIVLYTVLVGADAAAQTHATRKGLRAIASRLRLFCFQAARILSRVLNILSSAE